VNFKQLHWLRVFLIQDGLQLWEDDWVGSQDVHAAVQQMPFSMERADDSACLADQQDTCRHIPRAKIDLPKALNTTTSHVRQVQRG